MSVSLSTSLLTAGITALLGFAVFVVGQLTLKLFVEPIQDQKRIIGRTAHALTYYANVCKMSPPEDAAEGRKVYRNLASELRASFEVAPRYNWCVQLKLVRPVDQLQSAYSGLIYLSNNVGTPGYGDDDTIKARRRVEDGLSIKW